MFSNFGDSVRYEEFTRFYVEDRNDMAFCIGQGIEKSKVQTVAVRNFELSRAHNKKIIQFLRHVAHARRYMGEAPFLSIPMIIILLLNRIGYEYITEQSSARSSRSSISHTISTCIVLRCVSTSFPQNKWLWGQFHSRHSHFNCGIFRSKDRLQDGSSICGADVLYENLWKLHVSQRRRRRKDVLFHAVLRRKY